MKQKYKLKFIKKKKFSKQRLELIDYSYNSYDRISDNAHNKGDIVSRQNKKNWLVYRKKTQYNVEAFFESKRLNKFFREDELINEIKLFQKKDSKFQDLQEKQENIRASKSPKIAELLVIRHRRNIFMDLHFIRSPNTFAQTLATTSIGFTGHKGPKKRNQLFSLSNGKRIWAKNN